MNLRHYLEIAPAVSAALRAGKPVVALESTVLGCTLSVQEKLQFAQQLQDAVRAQGAVPALTAVVNGALCVGLSVAQLETLCRAQSLRKLSRNNLPLAVALGETGVTTVAGAMILACLAGVRVLAANGVGGVHRSAQGGTDASADLQELRQTPVAVVCSGVKTLPEAGPTLEYLETIGVPVLGLRTDVFPGFFCPDSGFGVDYSAPDEAQLARILNVKWALGLKGGALVANPLPQGCGMAQETVRQLAHSALEDAQAQGVRGAQLTPFVLEHLAAQTQGASRALQLRLMQDNACAAARVAAAL